jgi:sulfite reductase (NADPH) flavoprotein alpha-component
LHEFLQSKKAPKLSHLQYGVIGLGDSSYEFFCQTAKEWDRVLEEKGATRIAERVDCDVDYEDDAEEWIDAVLNKLQNL